MVLFTRMKGSVQIRVGNSVTQSKETHLKMKTDFFSCDCGTNYMGSNKDRILFMWKKK